ncbi:VPRE1 protein, partial [Atractosteus spatula]|nr:VPRE1 protein [Atractosteus spatula]
MAVIFPDLSYGDKVYPWKDFETSEETEETRIYCNYSLTSTASYEYLYWYQQRPGGNPRYILHVLNLTNGDQVYPWVDIQTSEETQETRIYCNYSVTSSGTEYLFWYQQRPGRNPRYILYRMSNVLEDFRSEEFDKRFTGYLNTSAKFTYLSISHTQLSDSALYYCALRPTVRLITV